MLYQLFTLCSHVLLAIQKLCTKPWIISRRVWDSGRFTSYWTYFLLEKSCWMDVVPRNVQKFCRVPQ